MPVAEARVLGEDGEDLEEDELEEVAGEGEDEAEEDLHQRPPLLVLLVQPPVQEPQPRPAQPHQRRAHHGALVDHRSPPHLSPCPSHEAGAEPVAAPAAGSEGGFGRGRCRNRISWEWAEASAQLCRADSPHRRLPCPCGDVLLVGRAGF